MGRSSRTEGAKAIGDAWLCGGGNGAGECFCDSSGDVDGVSCRGALASRAGAFIEGGIGLGGVAEWETVVMPAAHGRRKVGGKGQLESSSALLRFRDNIFDDCCV